MLDKLRIPVTHLHREIVKVILILFLLAAAVVVTAALLYNYIGDVSIAAAIYIVPFLYLILTRDKK